MDHTLKRCLSLFLLASTPFMSHAQLVDRFKSHTSYLASDELKGRGTGSEGIKRAAEYVEMKFKSIGLDPGVDGSYYQPFHIAGYSESEANIIGVIRAAVPTDRSLVFTAHYDALGATISNGEGDTIHNGAQDNAVGVAALIEMARLFMHGEPPLQNLVFVATAGEEVGQYGSLFYVENPVFPLTEITICLNFDGFNVTGPREDYFVMPRQGVDFIDEIRSIARSTGWVYDPPEWIDGMDTNFDTASFLAKGVPALTLWTGTRMIGGKKAGPIPFGSIHTPDDEINPYWNWEGVEAHLKLYKRIADFFLEHPEGITVTDPERFVRR